KDQAALLKQRSTWQNETVRAYKDVVDRFPDARNIDTVLYYLGYTLVQLDRGEEAFPYFTRIVRDIPTSLFAPDALLNVGEFYFNSGRMDEAQKIYAEVENFPKSNAFGLAIYKKGWCYYNMGLHDEAMNQFLKVIEFAKGDQAKAIGYGPQLLREAQRDLVMVYSQVGSPDQAIVVFREISPSNYMDLAGRLAEGYTSQGEYDKSSKLLKKIIAEYKDTPEAYKVIEYQRDILQNTYRLGVKAKVVEEARRLIGLLDRFRETAPREFYVPEVTKIEELLRVIVTSYHKEVAVTKEEATMELTHHLYNEYLRLFPDSPERYNMTLNYALLLAQLGKHAEAADRFSEVVAMKPDSEAALKAAHEAVSSYYKLMEASKQKGAKSEDTSDLEPKPLPEFETKLVAASDRYIRMAPADAPDLTEARFAAAMAYYQYNHFNEAAGGFRRIIATAPDHPNAPDAARLLLSSLHLMRDIKGLNQAADDISRNPKLMSGDVPVIVTRIKEQADFNKCYEYEQAGRHTTAAECFLDYVKRFPDTPLKDRALMNAGNNFFRARLVEKSLTANTQLVNDMPRSALMPQALFNIADTYRRLAVYSEAARFYEIFVQMLPKHDLTEEALRNATVFRSGLGDYELAVKDLTRYLELYGKSPHAPSVYQEIGNILLKQKKAAAAQKHFEQYLARYAKGGGLDLWVRAHLRIAHAWQDQGKADAALGWFKKTVQAYNTLPDDEKAKVTAVGLAAAAEARFMEGEAVLEEVRKIKLALPEKAIAEGIAKKLTTTRNAMDILQSVFAFQQPHWTIAALSRKGFAYQELATSIESAPVPPGLPREAIEFYKSGLVEKAQGTWERAKEEFKRCVETAQKLKWYNRYSTEAEEALKSLDPSFRSLPDIRPAPEFFALNVGKPTLVAPKEDEDAPKWTDPAVRDKVKAAANAGDASAEALYNMGAVLEASDDFAGARSWYGKSLAKKPGLAFAVARLGMLDLNDGKAAEAQAQIDRALQLDPANPTAHNRAAAKMIADRNFAEAVNHARMALVADPDSMDAYLNLAVTYYQMGLLDVGVLVGRNAVTLDAKDAPIQNMLGLIFLKKGEVRQAVQLFEKAASDDPKLFDAHMNLGLVTLSYKDFGTAAEHLGKASELQPRSLAARIALAAAFRGQARGDEARKVLDDLVKVDPGNPDPHYNLCLVYQETLSNSDEKALAECELFVRMAPPAHPKRKEAERRIEGIKATIEANREAAAAPATPPAQ
ncbi:MAG: tetratricopeptide repeat protein, partial [Deltaproteobacteria bacterium]|nr:tetratricopeptide repeat protein [Deltaproteobacteria bacterium]